MNNHDEVALDATKRIIKIISAPGPANQQQAKIQVLLIDLLEKHSTQPAAGEPVYQWCDYDGSWRDTDRGSYQRQMALGFETRIIWTAPPAAAHGDDAPGTVRVTADWLKTVHRDLDACQKVIWLAGCRPRVPGGFDPAYCEDAQARLKEIDEHIARAQGDGGAA